MYITDMLYNILFKRNYGSLHLQAPAPSWTDVVAPLFVPSKAVSLNMYVSDSWDVRST